MIDSMTEKSLKDLLNNLHRELESTEQVDDETRKLVEDLDEEINRLLDEEDTDFDFDDVVNHARSVEARFAVDHPVAERFLREIIDALAKVGI
jgi:division protein CdvB (Snf7/Vps24/ESCRT-III family)